MPRLGGVAIVAGFATRAAVVAFSSGATGAPSSCSEELIALPSARRSSSWSASSTTWRGSRRQEVPRRAARRAGSWSRRLVVRVLRVPGLGEVQLGLFGPVVTLLWIVGVTNAVNLLDGFDGLAGGWSRSSPQPALLRAVPGNPGTVILMAATAGACVGFLRHNWAPARIFMGDSGSLTLGFLLAADDRPLLAQGAGGDRHPGAAPRARPAGDRHPAGHAGALPRAAARPRWRAGFLRMFHADRNTSTTCSPTVGAGRPCRRLYTRRRLLRPGHAGGGDPHPTLGLSVWAIEAVVIVALRRSRVQARLVEKLAEHGRRCAATSAMAQAPRGRPRRHGQPAQVVAFPGTSAAVGARLAAVSFATRGAPPGSL